MVGDEILIGRHAAGSHNAIPNIGEGESGRQTADRRNISEGERTETPLIRFKQCLLLDDVCMNGMCARWQNNSRMFNFRITQTSRALEHWMGSISDFYFFFVTKYFIRVVLLVTSVVLRSFYAENIKYDQNVRRTYYLSTILENRCIFSYKFSERMLGWGVHLLNKLF